MRILSGATLLALAAAASAQSDRLSCTLMKAADLKPLLGADHDGPVPFGKESCRAETKGPGKMLVFGVMEQPAGELKMIFSNIKQINATHRAKEVTIVPEPAFGPDAFSLRSRGDVREVEFFAMKGARAVVVKGTWMGAPPLDDATIKQFHQLVRTSLDKLP